MITLTYKFGKKDKLKDFNFNVDTTWDDIDNYVEVFGGYIPDELVKFFDVDKLENDKDFYNWLKDTYEEKAKEKYEEEYEDILEAASDYVLTDILIEDEEGNDTLPEENLDNLIENRCKEELKFSNILYLEDLIERVNKKIEKMKEREN